MLPIPAALERRGTAGYTHVWATGPPWTFLYARATCGIYTDEMS